jgi:lipid A 3-O-deacylase
MQVHTLTFALGALLLAASAPRAQEEAYDGVWTFLIENDNFAFGLDDGNYTNGFALTYASSAVEERDPKSFSNRLVGWTSFLPFMDDERYRHHAAYTLGQLIFTPENISDPTPPRDDRPYTGVLFFDTSVYARTPRSLHAYTLRLGVTGDFSQAEETQKLLHKRFNTQRPRGWSHQIHGEPLVNLGYEYHRRLPLTAATSRLFDFTPNIGGTVGNYLITGNVGGMFRLGWNLPEAYGPPSPRTGFENHPLYAARPGEKGWYFLFGGVEGYWVGHDITLDGNTWKDSRSTDKKDEIGQASVGLEFAQGSFAFRVAFTFATDAFETQGDHQQLGSFSLSWFR